ncbi:uncharacterized protein [Chlorocebus sabaeus]|uniref:uncharacterized protein isoform X1 n=1 Tax=Chlorocebus sabaeus TaxID=60711 RepID=UPI003BF97064
MFRILVRGLPQSKTDAHLILGTLEPALERLQPRPKGPSGSHRLCLSFGATGALVAVILATVWASLEGLTYSLRTTSAATEEPPAPQHFGVIPFRARVLMKTKCGWREMPAPTPVTFPASLAAAASRQASFWCCLRAPPIT